MEEGEGGLVRFNLSSFVKTLQVSQNFVAKALVRTLEHAWHKTVSLSIIRCK